jgi:hypothetical protein
VRARASFKDAAALARHFRKKKEKEKKGRVKSCKFGKIINNTKKERKVAVRPHRITKFLLPK